MWQGGVNVNALISSPMLPAARRNTSWHGLAHSSDWLPTIASIAGMTFPLPEDSEAYLRTDCVSGTCAFTSAPAAAVQVVCGQDTESTCGPLSSQGALRHAQR